MPPKPNPGEDYLHGSSDSPRHGGGCAPLAAQQTLEERAKSVTIRKIDVGTGQLNVEATNEERRQQAMRLGLHAVIVQGGTPYFRRTSLDAEGLFQWRYGTEPKQIEPLHPAELVPAHLAALYLGIERAVLDQLVAEGKVCELRDRRGGNPRVSLVDVNKYASSQR